MKVYLAGPISGLTFDEAVEYRADLENALPEGWEALSPMRDKDYVGGVLTDTFDGGTAAVTRDLTDIGLLADAVLIDIRMADRVSVGTMAEMGYAFASGKPIVTLRRPDQAHCFIEYMSVFTTESRTRAMVRLAAIGRRLDERRNAAVAVSV